jgi:hypothetical protein
LSFSYVGDDAPKAKTKCKLFKGVTGFRAQHGRNAFVPARAKPQPETHKEQ